MACTTINNVKYIVYIQPGCYFENNGITEIQNQYTVHGVNIWNSLNYRAVFPSIININSEMNAGETGTIEVAEMDRKAKSSDGIRSLPDLELTLKVGTSLYQSTKGEFDFFADWWANRNVWDFTFIIMITNRAYRHLYGYKYKYSTISKFATESMGIEDTKKGQITMKFLPSDVILLDCQGNEIGTGVGNTIPTSFAVCA